MTRNVPKADFNLFRYELFADIIAVPSYEDIRWLNRLGARISSSIRLSLSSAGCRRNQHDLQVSFATSSQVNRSQADDE